MRKLPHPDLTGVAAVQMCASSIQKNVDLRGRLGLIGEIVGAAEQDYAARAADATLYQLDSHDDIGGHVTGKEMEDLYNNTFVKSSKTRATYEKIKKACTNDICPLCGQGTVKQLDHYLPITSFPVFGVCSINLVPACADCNKVKLARVPTTAGTQTLHPYFDEVEAERWLFARVHEIKPAVVTFFVNPPQHWDEVKRERIATHFRTFGLGTLYTTHAAVEINNMRFILNKMLSKPKSALKIRNYIRERAESCEAAHINSWQTATLDALSSSQWFCSGGFCSE